MPCGGGIDGRGGPQNCDNNLFSCWEQYRLVTRAACDMRTILRQHSLLSKTTSETQRWIRAHDAEDAKRIAKEEAEGMRQRVKLEALKKLNMEERRVLGL